MADDEQLKANLELPKFFGRRKKRPATEPEEKPAPEPDDSPTAETTPESQDAAPAEAEEAVPAASEAPDTASDDTDVVPPPPASDPAAEPEQLSDAPPAPGGPNRQETPEPATGTPAMEEPGSVATDEKHVDEGEATAETEPVETSRDAAARDDVEPTQESAAVSSEPSRMSRMRDSARVLPLPGLPALSGYAATAVTGAVIGLLLVGVTAATMKACGVIRGADTCGRAGFVLLAVIFVLMVFGSTWLLRAWQVREPGSTALLAVGIVAVVALLLLIDILFSWWMVIVIPIVSAAAFALSFWITDNYADEPPRDLWR